MYRSFFGLNDLPFRSTPDLKYFFDAGSRGDVVNAIHYALERGDGIVKIVGEVGVGKTTILRKLAFDLPAKYRVIYINSPNLQPQDILLFICHEFGIEIDHSLPKFTAISKLRDFFIENHALGRQCVIMIDEAQAIPIVTLEEIRLLLNLETEDHKLVQVLLFGQPELDVILQREEIRQFKSRVSHAIYLTPLNFEDVFSYLNFRMSKAGYQGAQLFNKSIAKKIAKASKGIVREIHHLADAALMRAYADNSQQVKLKHISSVQPAVWRSYAISGAFLFLVVSLVGLYLFPYSVNKVEILPAFQVSSLKDRERILIVETIEEDKKNTLTDVSHFIEDRNKQDFSYKTPETRSDEPLHFNSHADLLLKTKQSILSNESHRYSVQIIVSSISDFNRVMTEIAPFLDVEHLFWLIDGGRFILYYGVFSQLEHARALIQVLPPSFLTGNPFIVNRSQLLFRIDQLLDQDAAVSGI
ncbi:ExeA family protein [Thiomicrospira microaerophila]|uniref:ExeA family protein n=1 Tax=Thiomicrospira microaerophila TaxID=406020 RepID=UPI0006974EDC|nr:AAA family ATPase [Thiomicrospira microaerophila]